MMLSKQLPLVIKESKLEIIQYGIDADKKELNNINRQFDCYVISYIKKGSCKLIVDNNVFMVSAGDIIVIPPNVYHSHIKDTPDETTFIWFHFNYKYCSFIDVLSFFDIPFCSHINDNGVLEKVLEEYMALQSGTTSIVKQIFKEAKSLELIGHLLSFIVLNGNSGINKQYGVFLDIFMILSNDLQKDISLDSLAEQFNMHPTYLTNRFKHMYGITPIKLRNEVKMKEAKKLLQFSSMNIGEIGMALGFTESGDFSRFFKAREGISPIEYRNSHK